MSNYGELKTEVGNRLARSTTELTGLIPTFISESIEEICEENNWWFMKTTVPLTTSEAQTELHESIKEIDKLYIVLSSPYSYKELPILTVDDAVRIYKPDEETAEPVHAVIESSTMTLFPPPDKSYDLMILCWRYFDDLSDNADSNFLTVYKKKLVVAGALDRGFDYLQEYEDSAKWNQRFTRYMRLLRREHNSRILSGETTLNPKSGSGETAITERMRVGLGYNPLTGYM